jgi:hypothetical protein
VTFPQRLTASATVTAFVQTWQPLSGVSDASYNQHIHLDGVVSSTDVVELMAWKGGRRFAGPARDYGRAVPVEVINEARRSKVFNNEELRAHYSLLRSHLRQDGLVKSNGIVWPMFLCHISQPSATPVYDVNAWRAWSFLVDGTAWRDPKLKPRSFENYLGYRAWFNHLVDDHALVPRQLDRALMAFGQFLASRWTSLL